MPYVIDFDIMAFIISTLTLTMYSVQKQISTRQNIIFMFVLICSVISSLAGFLSSIAINNFPGTKNYFAYLVTMVFFINHNSIPICIFTYVLALTGRYPKRFLHRALLTIPYFMAFALILSNPVTNLIFYFSPEGAYCTGWGVVFLYGSAMLYIISIVFLFLFRKVRIPASIRFSIYTCLIIPISAIIIQMKMPYLLMESFAGAITFLFIFMSIQNKKYSIDPQTRFYTPEVFSFLIQERIEKENNFYVILLRSPDIPVLQELFDYERYSSLLVLFSNKVTGICKNNYETFFLEEGLFALIPKKNTPKSSIGSISLELVTKLEKIWTFETVQVELSVQVTILQYPLDFKSYQDVTERIELLSRFPRKIGNRHIFYGKDIQPGDLKYKSEIMNQLNDIFRRNSVEVRYQPIYNAEKKKFIALEATLFMANADNRQIRQHDIYDTAHNTGKSKGLSTILFRQAMWWFVKEKITSFEIQKLQIKLQEAQCINSNWACEILQLCRDCSFEPVHLCLQLSESILRFNETAFYRNLEILKEAGVNFAIDGFGTGFSDLEMIIKSPVDSIKLDKELIHESLASIKGKRLIKGTLSMFKQLSYDVVAEGVETQEQYSYLVQSGCTIFQGFFISRPAEGDKIIGLIQNRPLEI